MNTYTYQSDDSGDFTGSTTDEIASSLATAIAAETRFTASASTNVITVQEVEGEAIGSDPAITVTTSGNGDITQSISENSVAEVQGEYTFDIITQFDNKEVITVNGNDYANDTDFSGLTIGGQAQNLSAAIGDKDARFIDDYSGGDTVAIKEAEGEATGTDLTDSDISVDDGEVLGNYSFTVDTPFVDGQQLEIIDEDDSTVYTINFTDGGSGANVVDTSANPTIDDQVTAIVSVIDSDMTNHSGIKFATNAVLITEDSGTADGTDLNSLNVSSQ